MRPLILLLLCALCCAEPSRPGFVAFRMDLMRVPGQAERDPDKAIRHSASRRVMTVLMTVLSGTRAETRLYDRTGEAYCGFSIAASPEVHIPRRSALIDFSAFYRMPERGIFGASPETDFDSAVTVSSRRLLRIPKPVSTGLFAMPGEGAIVPLLQLDTLDPFFGAVKEIGTLECRLLSVSTEELRSWLEKKKIPPGVLSDPLPPENAVTAFASHPGSRLFRLPVVRGRGDFRSEAEGISISFRRLSGATFRLTFREQRTIGMRNGNAVQEEFYYEGYLLVSTRWMVLVRLHSPHAGKRAFFERENSGSGMEKLLLIRAG